MLQISQAPIPSGLSESDDLSPHFGKLIAALGSRHSAFELPSSCTCPYSDSLLLTTVVLSSGNSSLALSSDAEDEKNIPRLLDLTAFRPYTSLGASLGDPTFTPGLLYDRARHS